MKDIILLHGALGSASSMDPLKNELSKHFSTHTLEFSGHGKKGFNNKGFGIETFAEELFEFIDRNRIVKPHIFGYSMGGYVVLYLACHQPNLFDKIITLGTKFAWTHETAALETDRMDPDTMENKIPAYTHNLEMVHGVQWKTLVKETAKMMRGLGENPLLNIFNLKAIENTVCIMRGTKDKMVDENECIWAKKNIANADFYSLEGQPHPIEKVEISALKDAILGSL